MAIRALSTINSPEQLQIWIIVQSRRRTPVIFMMEMAVMQRLSGLYNCTCHALGKGHVYKVMLCFSAPPVRSSKVSLGFKRLSKHNVTPWVVLQSLSLNCHFLFDQQIDYSR